MKARVFTLLVGTALLGWAGTADAKVPFFNATCPGNIEVHADEGGPVYLNGKEAKLKRSSDAYYEARGGGVTVSISINPDGSPEISYTGPGRANGICRLKEASDRNEPRRERRPADRDRDSAQRADMGELPRVCRGEAADRFDRSPRDITTNMAFKSGDRYVVQGYFDGSRGTQFFNCYFSASGRFVSVN